MTKKSFSDNEALKFGWKKLGENWVFFLAYFAIAVLLSAVNNFTNTIFLGGVDQNHGASLLASTSAGIISIVFIIISSILSMGLVFSANKIYDGEKPDIQDLLGQYKKFFPYLIVSFLYFVIICAGFLLFIVPGIYWAIKYRFAPYLVITEGMSPIDAFIKSGETTAGVKWDLVGFHFVTSVVLLIGFCVLFIGIAPAAIIAALANIYVYRRLLDSTK